MKLIHCEEISPVFYQSGSEYPVGTAFRERITITYEFDYIVLSDRGKIITEGEETNLVSGMFFVRKPGIKVQGIARYHSWYLRFQTEEELDFPFSYCIISPEVCLPIFQKIYNLHIQKNGDYGYCMDYYMNTLIFLLHQEWNQYREKNIQKHPIAEIHEIMEKNWRKNYPLDYYAELSGYSKSRFCHLFQNLYQCSPMHFLQELRLQNICYQLIETDRPVKELMIEHGYTNEQSFFRYFKAKTGETPLGYRQKHRY